MTVTLQAQVRQIEAERGYPLTPEEFHMLSHCTLCGEPNGNCTHDQ